jgi:hypothetical protein
MRVVLADFGKQKPVFASKRVNAKIYLELVVPWVQRRYPDGKSIFRRMKRRATPP